MACSEDTSLSYLILSLFFKQFTPITELSEAYKITFNMNASDGFEIGISIFIKYRYLH